MNLFTPITMDDLHLAQQKLSTSEVIVDVRSPEEYADGHVPGAKNIPHDIISSQASELKKFDKIFIYCHAGGRVQMAVQELLHAGVGNLYGVIQGGMPNWESSGFTTER